MQHPHFHKRKKGSPLIRGFSALRRPTAADDTDRQKAPHIGGRGRATTVGVGNDADRGHAPPLAGWRRADERLPDAVTTAAIVRRPPLHR